MQKASLDNSRFMSRVLAICVVVGGLVASLSGQVTSGEILGLVRDPSGAGVTNAKITVRNLETNATREAMSEPDGSFRFPQLPIGPYESTVEKTGFAPHVRYGLATSVSHNSSFIGSKRVRLLEPILLPAAAASRCPAADSKLARSRHPPRKRQQAPSARNTNALRYLSLVTCHSSIPRSSSR